MIDNLIEYQKQKGHIAWLLDDSITMVDKSSIGEVGPFTTNLGDSKTL